MLDISSTEVWYCRLHRLRSDRCLFCTKKVRRRWEAWSGRHAALWSRLLCQPLLWISASHSLPQLPRSILSPSTMFRGNHFDTPPKTLHRIHAVFSNLQSNLSDNGTSYCKNKKIRQWMWCVICSTNTIPVTKLITFKAEFWESWKASFSSE